MSINGPGNSDNTSNSIESGQRTQSMGQRGLQKISSGGRKIGQVLTNRNLIIKVAAVAGGALAGLAVLSGVGAGVSVAFNPMIAPIFIGAAVVAGGLAMVAFTVALAVEPHFDDGQRTETEPKEDPEEMGLFGDNDDDWYPDSEGIEMEEFKPTKNSDDSKKTTDSEFDTSDEEIALDDQSAVSADVSASDEKRELPEQSAVSADVSSSDEERSLDDQTEQTNIDFSTSADEFLIVGEFDDESSQDGIDEGPIDNKPVAEERDYFQAFQNVNMDDSVEAVEKIEILDFNPIDATPIWNELKENTAKWESTSLDNDLINSILSPGLAKKTSSTFIMGAKLTQNDEPIRDYIPTAPDAAGTFHNPFGEELPSFHVNRTPIHNGGRLVSKKDLNRAPFLSQCPTTRMHKNSAVNYDSSDVTLDRKNRPEITKPAENHTAIGAFYDTLHTNNVTLVVNLHDEGHVRTDKRESDPTGFVYQNDFWRYFPAQKDDNKTFCYEPKKGGKKRYLSVNCTHREDRDSVCIRKLKVRKKGGMNLRRTKSVTHLHAHGWKDGDRMEVGKFLDYLDLVVENIPGKNNEQKLKNMGKVLIHCRSGVGRSGTLLTVLQAYLEGVHLQEPSDQEDFVKQAIIKGRFFRDTQFVQKESQLQLIFDALKELEKREKKA